MLALVLAACTPPDHADPDDTDPAAPPGATAETGTTAADCATRCDDGLACSLDTCDDQGRCIAVPVSTCPWPASLPPAVTPLAFLDPSGDLQVSLSGATWDPEQRALWTVRGNGATAWRFVEDGAGGWLADGKWSMGDIDAESVVVVDPVNAPHLLHVMVEIDERVAAVDVSDPDQAVPIRSWDTSPWLPLSGTSGSEGLAFVPDAALAEWGFVDAQGQPRTSRLGAGGLFFVGHQNGGYVYVFDLSPTSDQVEHVGTYGTARRDTSALEFDRGTGRLYLWHGDNANDLEVARLSSTDSGAAGRVFDTEYVFDYPVHPSIANLEGFALAGLEDCGPKGRPVFFTIDDGNERALDVYPDWPLCRP